MNPNIVPSVRPTLGHRVVVAFIFLLVIACVVLFWFVKSQIYACDVYEKILTSEETSNQVLLWAREKFAGQTLTSIEPDYRFDSGPGQIRYLGDYDLGFLPQYGIGMKVNLFIDEKENIDAVYIGRSARSGLIVSLNSTDVSEFLKSSLSLKSDNVAVHCLYEN